ncbi:MAG TPA: serine hydrolase [Gemmatimonadales bacterium]
MKTLRRSAAVLFAVSCFLVAGAPAQAPDLKALDAYIEQARKDWNVPGMSVGIVRNDSVVFLKGYGVRELGKPDPVTPNTLFAIGSNSKSFTATAVGMLADDGKMKFDDRVTKWLPEFQLFDPYVTREFTMRDAMSHRAGLGRRGDLLWLMGGYSRAEILRRVRFLEPNAPFRTEMGYQNMMFLAAGEAAGRAAGMSWDDLVTSRILRPLGMLRSNTSVTGFRPGDDVAQPHGMRDGAVRPIPWRNIDNIAPAGSINSSAEEMTRYLRMIVGGGTWEGKLLIRPAQLAQIATIHVPMLVTPDTLVPSIHFRGYGLGWGLNDYLGRKVQSHTGGIDGMLSYMWAVPEEKLGIIVLTNSDAHNMGAGVVYRILDAFLKGPGRDYSGYFLKQYREALARADSAQKRQEAARVTGTKPSLPLASYAGAYADSLWGEARIREADGALVIEYGVGGAQGKMEHWQYDTFRITWADAQFGTSAVTFRLGADGKVVGMTIPNPQMPLVFSRR